MDRPTTSNTPTTNAPQKPKIDPLQLLKCLSILLNPRGGIRGITEVQRVKGLMAKYSKKLVSKCIYLNILQATDLPLLDLFYEEGGWELVGQWLQEAVTTRNWPLATQVLNLLETSPMTVARLKRNTTPKLVKELSKDSTSLGVQQVAKRLVLKWMEVVRQGDGVATAAGVGLASSVVSSADEDSVDAPTHKVETHKCQSAVDVSGEGEAEAEDGTHVTGADSSQGEGGDGSSSLSCQDESSNTSTESDTTPAPTTPIRITIRSGSQVLAKVSSQRLSQDSTDSDDNKPLSIIKQEVEKARSVSASVSATITSVIRGASSSNASGLKVHSDESATDTAASSLETSDSAAEDSQNTMGVSIASSVTGTGVLTTNTTATTSTLTNATSTLTTTSSPTTTTTILTTTMPASTTPPTESTSTATVSAVHTIVTFTGSLNAASLPVTTQGNSMPSPPPDTQAQTIPESKEKSEVNGECVDDKVQSVTSEDKDQMDICDKSEGKSEGKNGKDKRSDHSKDKDRDKDRDRSKSSKSSSSGKSDKGRDRSSKDHDKSRSDKHKSSRDKDRRNKDRSKSSSSSSSSRDKRSSSRDKEKEKLKDREKDREKEKDKDKEREKREKDKKKKEQQENEDKATLEKVKPLSVDGLAKIPRKSTVPSFLDALGSADTDILEAKKPSVKTYKSRGFRNTGLLDEPTKLPSVAGKKAAEKKPSVGGASLATGMKRPSLLDDLAPLPDKRTRTSVSSLPLTVDKPGGVKLISPKRRSGGPGVPVAVVDQECSQDLLVLTEGGRRPDITPEALLKLLI